jgi:hypothetical protein
MEKAFLMADDSAPPSTGLSSGSIACDTNGLHETRSVSRWPSVYGCNKARRRRWRRAKINVVDVTSKHC